MKYKLQTRKIEESDLNVECPFMPEGDFEMYLNALKEDIQVLDTVISASLISDCLLIEINSEDDFHLMHSSVRQLLKAYNNKLKTVNGFMPLK